MSRVDTDQEGKLKLKEFKLMMQSLLDKPSKKAGKWVIDIHTKVYLNQNKFN